MTDQSDVSVANDKSGENDRKSDKAGLATSKDVQSDSPSPADNDEPETTEFECPVCLQNASFPVQLPCRHIFCFLCVKGFANRSKRCAMCRQEIPADFFNDPKLLREKEMKEKSLSIYDDGYQWFYEGRHGWWQYDDRTSNELEKKYKNGDKIFELLIAGFLYIIDLENMHQCRRNDQTRRRKVKRDMRTASDIKGIAGLRFTENQPVRPSGDGGETSQSNPGNLGTSASGISRSSSNFNPPLVLPSNTDGQSSLGDDSYLTPSAPNNTPQTPMTPADSQPGSLSGSQEDLTFSDRFNQLHVNSHPADASNFALDDYDADQFPRHYTDSMYPTPAEETYDSFESAGSDPVLQSRHLISNNTSSEDLQLEATLENQCPDDDHTHQGSISDDEDGDIDSDLGQLFVNDETEIDDNGHSDAGSGEYPIQMVHPDTGTLETYL